MAKINRAMAVWSHKRLPQVNGRLYLPGLHSKVTIHRDSWGIPHLQATSRQDLFLAQGFVHAQDRLWQMELNRRAAKGELSAIFGPRTLDTDRLARTLGFQRLAQTTWAKLEEPYNSDVLAYTAGVNALLNSSQPLPIEFSLLRHRPQLWQPLDTIAYGRLQMWALTHGATGELIQAQLIARLGAEKAADLAPRYPANQPVTLPDGIEVNRLTLDEMVQTAVAPFLGKGRLDGAGRGSNGWVIAPSHSTTGHAILCNDMHLPVGSPSLWYYLHLCSRDGFHVSGFSLPGVPYVLTGHNESIAWGATLAYTDCEDLFVEKLHPQEPTRYEFRGEWRQATAVVETIPVRGQPDHIEQVIITHHGPLLSRVVHTDGYTQNLALCSAALAPDAAFDGFARLNEATDWDSFTQAVWRIQTPSLNLLYADRQGNIGHYASGRVPVRANGDGLLPAPGWSGAYEWVGSVPPDEMPHALNPRRGFIVSANHCLVNESYPHFLGRVWRTGYRAQRLEQLLEGQTAVTLEDCQQFQNDVYSLPGVELVSYLNTVNPTHPDARLSLDLLRGWDGWLKANSAGGAVYEVLLRQLTEKLLEPHLGQDLLARFGGCGPHPILMPVNEFQGYWTVALLRWLATGEPGWLCPAMNPAAVLEACLRRTTAVCRALLGEDPGQWQWGRLHRVRFAHALGQQRPLDRIFNQGPYPIGGDIDTVAQTSIRADAPYDNNAISVSSRHIVDLGDLANSRTMVVPGQSGHLGSPHYGNMITAWLTGDYFRAAWAADQVVAAAQHTLQLAPLLSERLADATPPSHSPAPTTPAAGKHIPPPGGDVLRRR